MQITVMNKTMVMLCLVIVSTCLITTSSGQGEAFCCKFNQICCPNRKIVKRNVLTGLLKGYNKRDKDQLFAYNNIENGNRQIIRKQIFQNIVIYNEMCEKFKTLNLNIKSVNVQNEKQHGMMHFNGKSKLSLLGKELSIIICQ